MGTINDYISTQDEALTSGNYNEMDAAVFAQLSYIRFEDLGFAGEDTSISVSDYARAVRENEKVYDSLKADEKELIRALENSERYQNCSMTNFQTQDTLKVDGNHLDSQWAAYQVKIDNDTSVVAMRGTDGTTLGWREDFQLAYDTDGTNAQRLSAEYMKGIDTDSNYLTGHSKGGNDVIAAYIMSNPGIRDSVLRIDNFDGPGVNSTYQNNFKDGYSELAEKLNNYYPPDSVIGRLLIDKTGNTRYVQSEVREAYEKMGILGEHDLFSFVIDDGNGFASAKPSYLSNIINESLDKTVADLTPQELENALRMADKLGVYSLIAGDDNNPYADNKEQLEQALDEIDRFGFLSDKTKEKIADKLLWAANVYEAVTIYKNASPKEQQALKDVVGLLLSHAYQGIKRDVKNAVDNIKKKVISDVEKFFEKRINWLKGVRDKAAGILKDIKDGVVEKFESASRVISNFLEKWGEKIGRLGDVFTGAGNGQFTVQVLELRRQSANFKKAAGELGRQIQRTSDVKSHLDKNQYRDYYVALQTMIRNMELERRNCQELGETLEEIVTLYTNTEHKLCAL